MQIENEFEVAAPPDRVYAFLLDVNRVVTCMPGAELSEVVDPTTFRGKVKIKVGPITVSYNGTARIADRDDGIRTATLQAEGRETTGPGSARATARMSVEGADGVSTVKLVTDLTVAGRIANFGRGVMEDVSRRLVTQAADCIKSHLEEAPTLPRTVGGVPGEAGGGGTLPREVGGVPGEAGGGGTQEAGGQEVGPTPSTPAAAPTAAKPVNALSLMFAVLWDRIRRLFGRRRS